MCHKLSFYEYLLIEGSSKKKCLGSVFVFLRCNGSRFGSAKDSNKIAYPDLNYFNLDLEFIRVCWPVFGIVSGSMCVKSNTVATATVCFASTTPRFPKVSAPLWARGSRRFSRT